VITGLRGEEGIARRNSSSIPCRAARFTVCHLGDLQPPRRFTNVMKYSDVDRSTTREAIGHGRSTLISR
jgi:hypothetical protein